MKHAPRSRSWSPPRSAFAGFRFPAEVIVVSVRWYLRYGLSYRDVEELLAERGINVDHVTVYRWVLYARGHAADNAAHPATSPAPLRRHRRRAPAHRRHRRPPRRRVRLVPDQHPTP